MAMDKQAKKDHWEKIYKTKTADEVSWYQPVPTTSLEFINELGVDRSASIIDIGGGDSLLVDHLLDRGYTNITVLDISEAALERAKRRLGKKATLVKWLVADAADFTPPQKYDLWHDRAAFHFLTVEDEISSYITSARAGLASNGFMVLGTFSENGPAKCSGVEIRKYSENSMTERLKTWFGKIRCITSTHTTPFGTTQEFLFCCFRKLD
jgi:cyclopropane fatty-acyl-phospholipid synthase-like methyltransferase